MLALFLNFTLFYKVCFPYIFEENTWDHRIQTCVRGFWGVYIWYFESSSKEFTMEE